MVKKLSEGVTSSNSSSVKGNDGAAVEKRIRKTAEFGLGQTFQVWSLTQFYSVDFSKSRIDEKSAFSTNVSKRFASVVVDGVLGPQRLARHT